MAEDSDGGGDQYIRTVITCKGDLRDPKFPETFKEIIRELRVLLCQGSDERLRVNKVEPWNSVRVTFTIPAEAAERLRSLAQLGDPTLARLGILSVQLAADQVISLRLGGPPSGSEATASTSRQSPPAPAQTPAPSAAQASSSDFPPPAPATALTAPFRSPNVVAPPPQVIPHLPSTAKPPVFPFASMTHAASAIHTRENQVVRTKLEDTGSSAFASVRARPAFTPRYPGGQAPPQPSTITPLTAGARPTLAFRGPTPTPPQRGPAPPPLYPTPTPNLPPPQPVQQTLVNSTPSPIKAMLGRKSPPVERESTPPPLTSSGKKRQYLINPLTGVLEPMSSDSSSESDSECAAPNSTTATDDFTGSPTSQAPPPGPLAPAPPSSVFSDEDDDDDLTSTVSRRADTTTNESPDEVAPARPEPKVSLAQGPKPNEKIKLRLKLEKNEPVQQAYKVESLFINSQKPTGGEEPRVPPLHISLRGRNAAVVVNSRKDKKRLKMKKEPELRSKKKHSEDESPSTTELPCVRNYPTEEEVASILRSMPPQGHKLLSQTVPPSSDDKKREGKKRLWGAGRDRLVTPPMREDKRKKPGSLFKSVVKSAAKEVRMMTAARIPQASGPSPLTTGKATAMVQGTTGGLVGGTTHLIPARRDSNEASVGVTTPLPPPTLPHSTNNTGHLSKEHFSTGGSTLLRSKSLDGSTPLGSSGGSDDFRPKVNCVYKGAKGGGGSPSSIGPALTPKPQEIITVGMVTLEKTRLPVTDLDISERKVKERLLEEPNPPLTTTDERKRRIEDGNSVEGTNQGEDSGIESMDALSEKSPNQGESPGRKEEKVTGGEGVGEGGGKEEGGEDPVPIRLTPPLYTYSNPDKVGREETPSPSLDPSPSPINDLTTDDDGDLFATREARSSVAGGVSQGGKSLLEQLLIEIPQDNLERRTITRNTRSQNNRLVTRSPDLCRESPTGSLKRTRKASESSNASHDDPPTPRPSKRKCSENAAELIKACMGVEEGKRDLPSPSNSSSSSASGTTKTTATAKRKGEGISSLDFETSDEEEVRKVRDDGQPLTSPRLKKDDDKLSRRLGVLTTTGGGLTPTSRRSGRQSKGAASTLPLSPANGKPSPSLSPAPSPALPPDRATGVTSHQTTKAVTTKALTPKPSPLKDQLVRRKTRSIAAGEESIGKRRRASKEGK